MSERVREMALQAIEHAGTYDDPGTPVWFQMYNDKFARLVASDVLLDFFRRLNVDMTDASIAVAVDEYLKTRA